MPRGQVEVANQLTTVIANSRDPAVRNQARWLRLPKHAAKVGARCSKLLYPKLVNSTWTSVVQDYVWHFLHLFPLCEGDALPRGLNVSWTCASHF